MMLFDESEARTAIRGYLDSREWWMFLALDETGHHWVERVEEEFYDGDANGDFHLIVGALPGFWGVAFGKKSRATREGLETFMGRDIPEGLDVFGMGSDDQMITEMMPLDYAERVAALNQWIYA